MDETGRKLAEEFKITEYVHRFLKTRICPGDLCVDATMGNGADTEFLCRCSCPGLKDGMSGRDTEIAGTECRTNASGIRITASDCDVTERNVKITASAAIQNKPAVIAFDIQKCALEHTAQRLEAAGLAACASLIQDSHEHLDRYLAPETVKVIMFNLGYLPGGDHSITTRKESTITAAAKSLNLLVRGGILSILIYSGGDSGYGEKEAVLAWAQRLDPKKYLVIRTDYLNRPGDPPIPLFILRMN